MPHSARLLLWGCDRTLWSLKGVDMQCYRYMKRKFGKTPIHPTGPCALGQALQAVTWRGGYDAISGEHKELNFFLNGKMIVQGKCDDCGLNQDWKHGNNDNALWNNKAFFFESAAVIFDAWKVLICSVIDISTLQEIALQRRQTTSNRYSSMPLTVNVLRVREMLMEVSRRTVWYKDCVETDVQDLEGTQYCANADTLCTSCFVFEYSAHPYANEAFASLSQLWRTVFKERGNIQRLSRQQWTT